jgi:hypothetical protein
MKKALAALTAALTLCLIGSPASAAGTAQATLSADGRMTHILPGDVRNLGRSPHVVPAGMMTIYSTLNDDPNNVYDCCNGWTLSTTDSVLQSRQFIAMPFTPTADADIRRVSVAIGWVTGANLVGLSLRSDSAGLPGDVIKQAREGDLAVFGTCCDLTVVPTHPIHVTGGVQYWLVARATADTWGAWNVNSINAIGNFAFKGDGHWTLASGASLGAFSIEGN